MAKTNPHEGHDFKMGQPVVYTDTRYRQYSARVCGFTPKKVRIQYECETLGSVAKTVHPSQLEPDVASSIAQAWNGINLAGGSESYVWIFDRTQPEDGIIQCEIVRHRTRVKDDIQEIWFIPVASLQEPEESGCRAEAYFLAQDMADHWAESVFFSEQAAIQARDALLDSKINDLEKQIQELKAAKEQCSINATSD